MGKLISGLFGVFFAIAGPLALAYGGYWWAMDRPAWHVGWCPVCVGWGPGADTKLAAYAAAEKAAQAHARTIEAHQAQVTVQAAQHDATAQAQIITRYQTIIKEVHDVIPAATDARFPLSVGFVRLHDAAALGVDVSATAVRSSEPDDSASRVASSDLATIIAGNYRDCKADAQQLTDVQNWITDQGMAPK